jgi:hypothetical protein
LGRFVFEDEAGGLARLLVARVVADAEGLRDLLELA